MALGSGAGNKLTTGSNNVDIANRGAAGESGRIRIGTVGTQNAAYIAGISGASVPDTAKVVMVGANGKLGTTTPTPTASSVDTERPLAEMKRHDARAERRAA